MTAVKRSKLNTLLDTTLKQCVVTCWNSILTTLKSVAKNLPALHKLSSEAGANLNFMRLLVDLNKELLPAVIDVLEPFDRVTKHLSADHKPTLHLVVATKYQLQRSLSFVANDNEIFIQLKQHLTCKLNDSFHIVLLHYCACILNPRQKNNLNLMAPADCDSALHSLKQMVTAKITLANNNNTTVSAQQEVQPPSAKMPKVADAKFFDDLFI